MIERFESLLKPRKDFRHHPLTDAENNPFAIEMVMYILNELGLVIPKGGAHEREVYEIAGTNLKTEIARDMIIWMREKRPDALGGLMGLSD